MSQKLKHKSIFAIKPNLFTMFSSPIVDYAGKNSQAQPIDFVELIKSPFKKINWPKISQKTRSLVSIVKNHPRASLIMALLIVAAVFIVLKFPDSNPQSIVNNVAGSKTDFSPQSQVTVDDNFQIPIRNEKGDLTGDNLTVTVKSLDRSQKILIQGKPATARDTKAFLILNLEIDNPTKNQLTVRPVDLVRLIDSAGRNFAPDVHNEEVITEPISVKRTRVGFVIDESQRDFKFQIGEIGAEKETIEVTI